MNIELYIIIVLLIAFGAIMLVRSIKVEKQLKEIKKEFTNEIRQTEECINREIDESRQEIMGFTQSSFRGLGDMLSTNQKNVSELQDKRLANLETGLNNMSLRNEQKLENIRKTMEERLDATKGVIENGLHTMQDENSRQMEKIRATVDEKLQQTLEDRISKSFRIVSERLEEVYKGLGEMQNLASGVGDLKKVLSNVKTRGILGEIQLGAIMEQILSHEQYDENVSTRPGSSERVEFALKIPSEKGETVYLPIDAKFPADAYTHLMDAYNTGNQEDIDRCAKNLDRAIKKAAKDIHEKYVQPPYTTDFAIMFLPFEGLYAEVIRRGLIEELQATYRINIAGPTTMAALLNSLQMGFRAFAIQKHSGEVWKVLGAVKTEFDKFGAGLMQTQKRIMQAHDELDTLVGTRTRTIQRKLQNVTELSETNSRAIFGIEQEPDDTEES